MQISVLRGIQIVVQLLPIASSVHCTHWIIVCDWKGKSKISVKTSYSQKDPKIKRKRKGKRNTYMMIRTKHKKAICLPSIWWYSLIIYEFVARWYNSWIPRPWLIRINSSTTRSQSSCFTEFVHLQIIEVPL